MLPIKRPSSPENPSGEPSHPPAHSEPDNRRPDAISMHEDVELWCDVCCCEPEPRWQALADELERERQQCESADNAFDETEESGEAEEASDDEQAAQG